MKYLKGNPDEKVDVFVYSGDGGAYDIGIRELMEVARSTHRIKMFIYDNEAYMNTGNQESGATNMGAATTTSFGAEVKMGREKSKVSLADMIASAYPDVQVTETNPDFPMQFARAMEKTVKFEGVSICNIASFCPPGSKINTEDGREISRLKTASGMYPLVEHYQHRTVFEKMPAVKSEESLLEWMKSQEEFGTFFIDSSGEEDEAVVKILDPKYDVLEEIFQKIIPIEEVISQEGKYSHMFGKGQGGRVVTSTAKPILVSTQIDVMIRWLQLCMKSDMIKGTSGKFKDKKEKLWSASDIIGWLKKLLKSNKAEESAEEFEDAEFEFRDVSELIVEVTNKLFKIKKSQLAKIKENEKAALEHLINSTESKEEILYNPDEERRKRNASLLSNKRYRIKWHGIGGQGAQVAGKVLGAVSHMLGFHSVSWLRFGPERRGAPTTGYNILSGNKILDRSDFEEEDMTIVLSTGYLENPVWRRNMESGLGGILIVNSDLDPGQLRSKYGFRNDLKLYTVDLSGVATKELGKAERISIASIAPILEVFADIGIDIEAVDIDAVVRREVAEEFSTNLGVQSRNMQAFENSKGILAKENSPIPVLKGDKDGSVEPPSINMSFVTGNEAVADAVELSSPGVIAAYPITPSTIAVEALAKRIAQGKMEAGMIKTLSETGAIFGLNGAQMMGVDSFTATASQGLMIMSEGLYLIAGLGEVGAPPVMYVSSRGVSRSNLTIYDDHSDTMLFRDAGWVQLFCSNAQELYDMQVMAPLIAKKIGAPVMVIADGFRISHTRELVEKLDDEKIKALMDRVPIPELSKWKGTANTGSTPAEYAEAIARQAHIMELGKDSMREVFAAYNEVTGREYDPIRSYDFHPKAEETDVGKADAEETDAEKVDADETDAEKADAEETDAEKADAEETDAEKADAEETDAGKADAEKTDAEETDAEKIKTPKTGILLLGFSSNAARVAAKSISESTRESVRVIVPTSFVPFYGDDLADEVEGLDVLYVVDKAMAPGSSGPLYKEVLSALSNLPEKPIVVNGIMGMGGRTPGADFLKDIITRSIILKNIGKPVPADSKVYANPLFNILINELGWLYIHDQERRNPNHYKDPEARVKAKDKKVAKMLKYLKKGLYDRFIGIPDYVDAFEGVVDERGIKWTVLSMLEAERAAQSNDTAELPDGDDETAAVEPLKSSLDDDWFGIEDILLNQMNDDKALVEFMVNIMLTIGVKKKIKLLFDENIGKGSIENAKIWEIISTISELKKYGKFKGILSNIEIDYYDPLITVVDEDDKFDEVFVFAKIENKHSVNERSKKVYSVFIDESNIPGNAVYPIVPIVAISLGRRYIGDDIFQTFDMSMLNMLDIESVDSTEARRLIFYLLPSATRYTDKGKLIKQYAILRGLIQSV